MADSEKPQSDDPAYMAVWDRYKAIKEENQKFEIKLKAKYGPNAALDQSSGAVLRMEQILEVVLPSDTVERLEFEIQWQEIIKISLQQLHQVIVAQQVASGKKLIIPDSGGGPIVP